MKSLTKSLAIARSDGGVLKTNLMNATELWNYLSLTWPSRMQVAKGWGLDCIAGVVIIICTFKK
jgi:hypothetical protein